MMLSRRNFLKAGVGGALSLAGGGVLYARMLGGGAERILLPREGSGRDSVGPVREFRLTARVADWEIGSGRVSPAWTYDGRVPGPEIRVKEGERLRVVLTNELPEPTTIHWHGLPVPHAMDGVPELTQRPVAPGERFAYEFTAGPAGTYWYHSHVNYQLDRGLLGPLVIEPAREALEYDREYVLVLDDWLFDPENAEPDPSAGMGMMGGMMRGMMGRNRSGSSGRAAARPQPRYDAFTVNGLSGDSHPALRVRKGDRVRLRLINASAATVIPVRLAGHRLTVTHSDGQPVQPLEADGLRIGMGERYDVLFTADRPGIWPLEMRGADGSGARLLVRYDGIRSNTVSQEAGSPASFPRYGDLQGLDPVRAAEPDRMFDLTLSGGMMAGPTVWTLNGRRYPDTEPLEVNEGERVRLRLFNMSMMPHPMHLHGHFFDVVGPDGRRAASPIRKDTLLVDHMQRHVIDFTADNPGARWFLHCHNLYHQHGGMATEVQYR
jgi:FtsP/CotA-like multicopper oxidase with cupredoxin domain